jgi:hypothetical protein
MGGGDHNLNWIFATPMHSNSIALYSYHFVYLYAHKYRHPGKIFFIWLGSLYFIKGAASEKKSLFILMRKKKIENFLIHFFFFEIAIFRGRMFSKLSPTQISLWYGKVGPSELLRALVGSTFFFERSGYIRLIKGSLCSSIFPIHC